MLQGSVPKARPCPQNLLGEEKHTACSAGVPPSTLCHPLSGRPDLGDYLTDGNEATQTL